MSADPINANPTVLDLSELPTRQNDGAEDAYYASSKKSARKPITPLDTFSREILTTDLWSRYHYQDTEFYSILDEEEDDEASDPEGGNSASESEEELETRELDIPGSLSASTTSLHISAVPKESKPKPGDQYDPIDSQEIYDLISTINDPEHPLTLGQLAVVNLPHIYVTDSGNPDDIAEVFVEITPTITHCSLATLIGLGIRVRLERALPPRYRIVIKVRAGTHQSEKQVNKQLNDKERVAAACENQQLLGVISNMLASCT